MLTLWDLVEPVIKRVVPLMRGPRIEPRAAVTTPGRKPAVEVALLKQAAAGTQPAPESMQDRYDRMTRDMLAKYGVKVRRWRTSMSGVAWQLKYHDGSRKLLIEAPRPKGPMSAAIFLHEIGHHAIGFDRYKPRCLEEYHAWAWAIQAMKDHDLNVTEGVLHRMKESLWYAASKAQRRGIRSLPPELEPYQTRPPRRRKGRTAEA